MNQTFPINSFFTQRFFNFYRVIKFAEEEEEQQQPFLLML
jgi:hypothetical protein